MYENVTYGPSHFRLPSWVKCEEKLRYPRNSTLYQVSDLTNTQKFTCNVPGCGIQYVGQTQNRIMDRFTKHLSTIRLQSDTTMARHMASHNIVDDPPITISILQLIKADPKAAYAKEIRNKWENIWMSRLNSFIPHGLNIQD